MEAWSVGTLGGGFDEGWFPDVELHVETRGGASAQACRPDEGTRMPGSAVAGADRTLPLSDAESREGSAWLPKTLRRVEWKIVRFSSCLE